MNISSMDEAGSTFLAALQQVDAVHIERKEVKQMDELEDMEQMFAEF